ncbi:hypothetical protein LSH36_716g01015 [Paralvinella palmiformis]|uniref:Chromodomain-helicase-DNA-binding protein 1-like n=1 Tax=Paralvinella palmiformis TaxID=53620 RepID=A0AAD9MT87_9ANNE|nr:hypothetical protein LSH36_716g01015 [Paralvinella palmiformis]
MDILRQLIEYQYSKTSSCPPVDADILINYGLEDITLRPYQVDGIKWLAECFHRHHGCILADEMGLGKTCQAISFLLFLKGCGESSGPHLVISPLTVLSNWSTELKSKKHLLNCQICVNELMTVSVSWLNMGERFAPSLKVLVYVGNKEERPELQMKMKTKNYNILLTTYEFNIHYRVLLTGTPVQNNLEELYTLLSFVAANIFKDKYLPDFVETFTKDPKLTSNTDMSKLHDLLRPFLLRRVKSEVIKDLPKKTEVILFHGMSALQKKYYKALLTKDIEVFENPSKITKTRLLNILVQLRKCVGHPYLFDGVEPEPFQLGEHLVEASGKLVILDRLLSYLQAQGHKVLIFSQMTRMLDIIQDYLGYRGYSYERLDGSVRGEERYLAVKNFNEDEGTFIFLLSTRAGGQGLNLVAADTVIFLDSDFNPQNDLQAAARAHRIGQTRAVRVIRLIGRSTAEEIVLKRALAKLALTHDVIEGGQFSTASDKADLIADDDYKLQDILKFGVHELFENEDSTIEDVDFEMMLGKSENGEWLADGSTNKAQASVDVNLMSNDKDVQEPKSSLYVFEGKDYSKEPTAADRKAFDELLATEAMVIEQSASNDHTLRKHGSNLLSELSETSTRKPRQPLTPEQLEARRQKMAETMARRAKEAEELAKRRAEQKNKRKEEMWLKHGYSSLKITLDSSNESEDQSDDMDVGVVVDLDQSDDESNSGRSQDLGYLVGDITQPQHTGGGKAIIVHCLDDSGYWGRGGLFTAINNISDQPKKQYELADEMKDLHLGDVHLVPMDDKRGDDHLLYCALVIAQHRDRKNNLTGIKLMTLSDALHIIYKAATDMKASVHLPRIGYNTPGFNWYGTERLIRKHLSSKGIRTYVYYYPRREATKRKPRHISSESDEPSTSNQKVRRKDPESGSSDSQSSSPQACSSKMAEPSPVQQPDAESKSSSREGFMSGVTVHFHKVPQNVINDYTARLTAQDGDVDEFISGMTTHVIVEDDLAEDQQDDLLAIVDEYRHTPVVRLTWLSDCFRRGTGLPHGDYLFG